MTSRCIINGNDIANLKVGGVGNVYKVIYNWDAIWRQPSKFIGHHSNRGSNLFVHSPDGFKWYTNEMDISADDYTEIIWFVDKWIMFKKYAVYESKNGINWTQKSTAQYLSYGLAHNGSVIVSATFNQKYMVSSDGGSTWSYVNAADSAIDSIVYDKVNGRFISAGYSYGNLYSSTNGTSWTKSSSVTSKDFRDIGTANGVSVVSCDDGNTSTGYIKHALYYSNTATSWAKVQSFANRTVFSICGFKNKVYVLARDGVDVANYKLYATTDGANYTEVFDLGSNSCKKIAASDDAIVVCREGGTYVASKDGVNFRDVSGYATWAMPTFVGAKTI